MTESAATIEWSGDPLLAPFAWRASRDVLVPTDIFAPDVYQGFQDKLFAVMALCPQHRFRLVTDFPEKFHAYVDTITNDRSEWLTWRVEASFVLRDLGREHEATGHGPVWPLKNVALADFRRSLN
ncbi:MAG: DUF5131 family protein [Afipia sp.]|nr:DUF5131 family protein [Afipia sp.]